MSAPIPPRPASSPHPVPPVRRVLINAGLLALFAAAMWFAWLGWDHTYYDVDGVAEGPYRAWQVIGCGLSIGSAAVLAYWRAPRALAIPVLAIAADGGFAVPWSIDASSGDETGLWVVGLVLLVLGGCVALGSVLSVTHLFRHPESSSTWILIGCAVLALLTTLVYAPVAVVPVVAGGLVFFFRWLPDRRRPGNRQAR
ncbi:hypothetical protein [uncultured Jatrophihabitans sp.]|uniref:hypothetical protein n=1 Tax=uncultured Jatrophihabitans sp. TaxID=1610747 RepID=UPI0035CB8B7E